MAQGDSPQLLLGLSGPPGMVCFPGRDTSAEPDKPTVAESVVGLRIIGHPQMSGEGEGDLKHHRLTEVFRRHYLDPANPGAGHQLPNIVRLSPDAEVGFVGPRKRYDAGFIMGH